MTEPGVDVFDFYPRSYDLSEYNQLDSFTDDFTQTAVLSCLKSHALYFKRLCKQEMLEIELAEKGGSEEHRRHVKRVFVSKFPPKGTI